MCTETTDNIDRYGNGPSILPDAIAKTFVVFAAVAAYYTSIFGLGDSSRAAGPKGDSMYTVYSYFIYLIVSVVLTIWVARTLHRNGRIFLVEAFRGNEQMADSVNHLLVVGFYLINIGFVTLALKYGDKPGNTQGAIEFVSTKVGFVLVVLGVMHFFNMFNFDKLRHKGRAPRHEVAAVTPLTPIAPPAAHA